MAPAPQKSRDVLRSLCVLANVENDAFRRGETDVGAPRRLILTFQTVGAAARGSAPRDYGKVGGEWRGGAEDTFFVTFSKQNREYRKYVENRRAALGGQAHTAKIEGGGGKEEGSAQFPLH